MFKVRKLITSYLLVVLLLFISCFPVTAGISDDPTSLKEITVVSDDNYPPYIFRDENGHLQGILVDEWQLWEEKTGIKVDLRGMDWDKAKKMMAEGNAHVIDTIFFTEERAKKLTYTAPYASIDVPIFFHNDISGIKDVKSLRGFTIGVKAGDACIDFLRKNGISSLQEFPSYESIIRAALEKKIKIFCIDAPPALYYLNKMNIAQDYRYTDPLYTGQFHRAVQKERKDLLAVVESGFTGISQKEHEEIRKRWFGAPIPMTRHLVYIFYLMGALVLLGGILLLWNYTLRRKVTQKTAQLSETINALQKSEEKYRLVVENADEAILIAQDGLLKYVNPMTLKLLGYSEDLLTSKPFIEIIHPEDRERLFEAHSRRMKGEETQPVTQFRVIARDGTSRLADSHAIMISWEGKPATLNYITDITERKRAEETLRESEEKYRWVVDNMADAITVMDMNLRFTYVSPSIMRMRGYTAEEATAQTFEQVMTPESLQIIAKVFEEEMKLEASGTADPGRSRILELEEYRKDGSIVWMENNLSFIRDEAQKPVGIISLSRDITDRKRAEEAIVVAKNDWENTFDAVTDMVTIHDIDFNIIRANPAAKAMLGIQLLEEMPLAKCFRLYHGTEKPPSECASCESLQTGRPSIVEVFEPHLNKYLEIRAMPRFGSDGRLVGLIHVVRDITERKQAEEALQAGRLQLKAILDNIPDIAWLKDKESRLIAVNEPFGKSCGFEPEDLVGKTDLDIWPRDLAEKYRADDKEVMESGKRKQVEEPLKDVEGSILWIETIKTPIYDEHGDISGTAGIARDITAHKRAEEKLQKTLKSLRKVFGTTIQVMVSAVETRDPYTSGHQIRTANLARAIATEMGLSEDRIEAIRMAGPIHDIGKLSIPAEILSKPGRLSQIEFSLIKEHARKGYEMLKDVESPWPLAEIVYQHHERMDGSGYPRNLKGDEILIEARILAVADVVEAIASHRPYRPGLGIDAALNEIEKNRGIFYDNTVADACLRLFREKGFKLEGT